MSKEISTIKGATYVVTPTKAGTVSTPGGIILVSFIAGAQTTFVATSKVVIISDDGATVDMYFNPAAPAASGGGRLNLNTELLKHLADSSAHLSADERAYLQGISPGFGAPDPPVPAGALAHGAIRAHFALHAQPGFAQAPAAVYVSRVPWARWEGDAETGQWVNNASAVEETVFGVSRKFMDNEGLEHACSTDSEEGADDYNGKLWPFYWQHANYITDEHGTKFVTAIKGVHDDFDPLGKDVCSFGPAFWFFCALEHSQKEDGSWNTHDGTESGTPLFQLWGISTRPWAALDDERRRTLTAHGVTEADFHLWPECQQWDETTGTRVPRPYWCHSAYCGGAELQETGSYRLASKRNLPLFNNLSHYKLNELYGWKAGRGGSACVNGFGVLFDIVKNATKNSQSIHSGMGSNNTSPAAACQNSGAADYVFPIATKGNFEPGGTVWLTQSAGSATTATYACEAGVQIGRIAAIEQRTLTLADGTQAEQLCLVIDPATVEPFVTRTDSAAAQELCQQGILACCYACQSFALAGETDAVLGRHDGSCTSNTNGKHPYRVQGTEYMPGGYMIAADTVAAKGNGETPVTLNGETTLPGSDHVVILQAPQEVPRADKRTLSQFLECGYIALGFVAASAGYIVNAQMGSAGVLYPVAAGGTGSGNQWGHGDTLKAAGNIGEWLMGGPLSYGGEDGSAHLHLGCNLHSATWIFSARD